MDENRRKFLKVMLIGSGAFLAEKIFGPLFSQFNKTGFRNFQIVENKEKLSIYDSSGEEIFQIDDEV